MAIEATIVEQLQEFRRWQIQQQEELTRQQQEQRDMLNNEHNRMFQALNLSVAELSISDQTLQEFIEEHRKEEANLIDFDTPESECSLSMADNCNNIPKCENNMNVNNRNLNLKVPKVQLAIRNTKTDSKPNVEFNNLYDRHDCSSFDHSTDDAHSLFYNDERSRSQILIDDIPVPSPKKDFNTLLEERLKESESVVDIETKSKPVIKRPFLKKGEGLARFMPNSVANRRVKTTLRPRSASFTNGTRPNSLKSNKSRSLDRGNSISKSKKNEVMRKSISNHSPLTRSKLTLKNVPPPQKKRCSKSMGSIPSVITPEKKKPMELVSDTPSSDLDIKNKRELEEVRIFELLEDKAENSSFCSTSSTVIAFLQQSTPLKQKAFLHSATKHQINLSDIGDQTLEDIVKTKLNQLPISQIQKQIKDTNQSTPQMDKVSMLKVNDKVLTKSILSYKTDANEHYEDYEESQYQDNDENNVSLHVRFSEHNEYKTMTDTSSTSSDSQTIISYFNDKAWSDCSATPDSSDIESVTTQSKALTKNDVINSHKYIKENQADSDEENTENSMIHKTNEEESDEQNEEKVKDVNKTKNGTVEEDETLIDENNDSLPLFKSELLKKRLIELEQEIEIFRKESAALTLQRQKLQEERTKLQEERIIFQRGVKEKEESLELEKKKAENILQEEKKRLAREKAALENRMKDAYEKAQKSKQERHEIQALKDQLEELKEEFDQKESKWAATSARQRSQMRVLQTENSKLKQELEKLQQRKNTKLKRSNVSSNTKAIHQINKFLADRKKISPFKNDNGHSEEIKVPESINVNCDVDLEAPEENSAEEEHVEKGKILKTAQSIARTRNLYESLLKDATLGFAEINVGRKNLMNRQVQIQEMDQLNDEDQCEDESEIVSHRKRNSTSPKSSNHHMDEVNEEEEELENVPEEKNNKIKIDKSKENKQSIREVQHSDGRVEYWYPNGNVKKVYPDTNITKMIYYNGDVRETDINGTVKYFYAATRTWHTTTPDGLEILEFPDGQVERRSKNGTIEVSFPDGSVRIMQADGSEKWALLDGTTAETSADGEKILTLPNGQREIHTKDHKRREYPDGTVKLVYPDGMQETRYANGRIRLKDKHGNLLMDTHQ